MHEVLEKLVHPVIQRTCRLSVDIATECRVEVTSHYSPLRQRCVYHSPEKERDLSLQIMPLRRGLMHIDYADAHIVTLAIDHGLGPCAQVLTCHGSFTRVFDFLHARNRFTETRLRVDCCMHVGKSSRFASCYAARPKQTLKYKV